MEKLKLKYESLYSAINSLNTSIEHLEKVEKLESEKNLQYFDYEDLYRAARDSLIQRFEFTIELFWKYLKLYLVEIKNVKPVSNTPTDIIREGCRSGLITEKDTENFISMLKSRNLSSHIYKEETADLISKDIIFNYYKVLKFYTDKLKP